jgi:tetratricopeptide (TPR) repeat protein
LAIRFRHKGLAESYRRLMSYRTAQDAEQIEAIQSSLKEFCAAAEAGDATSERDLVRMVTLYAFGQYRNALSLGEAASEEALGVEGLYVRASALVGLYQTQKHEQHVAEAIAICDLALGRDPLDARFHYLRGTAMYLQLLEREPKHAGRHSFAEAESAIRRAMECVNLTDARIDEAELRDQAASNLAYFVSITDPARSHEAEGLMERLGVPREQWPAAWLDTFGLIQLQIAQQERGIEKRSKRACVAHQLFAEAVRRTSAGLVRQRIEHHLRAAQGILRGEEEKPD